MKKEVLIHCTNTSTKKAYPFGTSLLELQNDQGINEGNKPLCAMVNNEVKELNFLLFKPKKVTFETFSEISGHRTYVRSLAFVFYKALKDLFPGATLRIEHPVSNGYFCQLKDLGLPLTAVVIARIKARMEELVLADISFIRHEEETEKVLEIFSKQGLNDKVRLLESVGRVYSAYYTLQGCVNYFYGPLVPSTAYLSLFNLVPYYDGVLLQIPVRSNPHRLEEVQQSDQLMGIFRENAAWNEILNLSNIGDLNSASKNNETQELIKVAEAFQEKKVARIADQIAAKSGIRIVLVAGPSSSGKTTFSKRLSLQLKVSGLRPRNLSMDNYFIDREHTPTDEEGNYDFESLYALDLKLFNDHLLALMSGHEVNLPEFSFAEGKAYYNGNMLKLHKNDVLIVEGIHALNPELTASIPADLKFGIYVSALTTISIDDHNWIPTSDNRLIRRIVRDHNYRGYSAKDTISRWESVRKGENKWIYPYQENADAMFNSALLFELAVLKIHAEPILREVKQDTCEFAEAQRLLHFLSYFNAIRGEEIPPTSLLREFLGGSSFVY